MLKIEQEGKFKEPNNFNQDAVKASDQIEELLVEYSDIFHGTGCFKEKGTGKKMEVKLEIDPEATSIAQNPRNVPYHLQKPLKK